MEVGSFSNDELSKRRINTDDPYGYIDFTNVKNGAELLNMLNDDALAWATAFRQYTKKPLDVDLDLMYVQGWFANAIETSNKIREDRKAADEEYNLKYRE